jgi:rhomboid protease GluP
MDSNWSNGHSAVRAASVQPEILPPLDADGGARSSGTPNARSRNRWAAAPATYLLVGINVAVYLLMSFRFSTTSPTAGQLLAFGADNGGAVLLYGQWWRLVTSTFIHASPWHIAGNMWCLWNLGLLGEPLLGPLGTVLVYLFTGIAGNLLSIAVNPGLPGEPNGMIAVGASGAIFGLAGVLIILLKSKLLPVPEFELKKLRRSVIYFAVLNFALGAGTLLIPTVIRIDQMAHLGGFLSGLAIGVPLVPRIGARRAEFVRRQWFAFAGAALVLALLAYGIFSYARPS